MLFITLNPQQVASYSYACVKLENILERMTAARKKLEEVASLSKDNFFSKCIYMFNSESLQMENEIHAQIESFNCGDLCLPKQSGNSTIKKTVNSSFKTIQSLYKYVEKNYIQPYKQLLKDKQLNYSLKRLMQTHLQVLMSNLTQLKLFLEVSPSVN